MKRLITTLSALALLLVGVAAPAPASDQHMNIDTRSRVVLTADHHGPILITAGDVVLDCAGHAVVGPGWGEGITLREVTGVTVRNCRVSGFGIGIMVFRGGDNRITGNSVSGNTDSQVRLEGSHGNVISDNEAEGGSFGIILFGSDRNSVRDNTVEDAEWIGFGLEQGSSDNDVRGNEATGGTASLFNVVGTDPGPGFAPARGNVLRDNVAQGGGHGFYLAGATGNELVGNTSLDPEFEGFALGPLDWGDTPVTGSHENVLRDNVATGHGGSGFGVVHSDDNVLHGNRAEGGNGGFFVLSVERGTLKANEAFDNTGSGFWIGQSHGLAIVANKAFDNDDYGFLLTESSSGNLIRHNAACDNGEADGRDDEPGPPNTWEKNDFCIPLSVAD